MMAIQMNYCLDCYGGYLKINKMKKLILFVLAASFLCGCNAPSSGGREDCDSRLFKVPVGLVEVDSKSDSWRRVCVGGCVSLESLVGEPDVLKVRLKPNFDGEDGVNSVWSNVKVNPDVFNFMFECLNVDRHGADEFKAARKLKPLFETQASVYDFLTTNIQTDFKGAVPTYKLGTLFLFGAASDGYKREICTYIYGQNVKDFNSLMSYQNENGTCLKSFILPFRMYDYSKGSDKFVNITVIGCVHRPGVFILPDGATLESALGMAAPIKEEEHPVHALGVSFLFRDKGFIRLDHDANKSHKLLHGDVVYVENSVF